MPMTATILAGLIFLAGWYCLFYSRAAQRLGAIEEQTVNRQRVRLRRANGLAMVVLAGLYFALYWMMGDRDQGAWPLLIVCLGIFLALFVIVLLALIDVRLTWKLRAMPKRVSEKEGDSR